MLKEHPWADPKIIAHCQLLKKNYFRYTNKELINYQLSENEFSFFLYQASFVIVSHGIEEDPIFNYANLEAQKLWKMDWKEFILLPSRLSAEEVKEEERKKALEETTKKGFIDKYNGIRISKSGKRFEIKDVIIFNLYDDDYNYKGQAAMFEKWEYVNK